MRVVQLDKHRQQRHSAGHNRGLAEGVTARHPERYPGQVKVSENTPDCDMDQEWM